MLRHDETSVHTFEEQDTLALSSEKASQLIAKETEIEFGKAHDLSNSVDEKLMSITDLVSDLDVRMNTNI